jgi:KDO2-lipid IV(A) lauroyltransferase
MDLLTPLRIRLEYALFRLLAAIGRALPLDFASAVSGFLWRVIAPRLKRQQRALEGLARAFPEKSLAERERIALAMWDNLGRSFAEFFDLQRIMAEGRIAFEPLEKFEAIFAGGPFVICTLHMGNWELAAHVGGRFGAPLAGVYQALTNPLVDRWTYEQRLPLYGGGLYDKSFTTSRALFKIARNGGYPAIVGDLREGRGLDVPFFGHLAVSNPFPALLARVAGIPLYAIRVKRVGGARFVMRIEPVAVPVTDSRDADVLAATAGLQARFEEFIREAPEQWMWAHRRWAHRSGKRRLGGRREDVEENGD